MLRIGLTGGIGSGKTTVARIFEALGIPVFYADDEAKRLMNEDEQLKKSIIDSFGEESYSNGQLNRKYISEQVFNDPYKLELLNSVVHPATIRNASLWMSNQRSPYVIKEAALIFEAGAGGDLDHIIGVTAPPALRIHRVMKRDNVGKDEVLRRMRSQIDETIKMKLCDFILDNDEQKLLTTQVLELHKKLVSMSSGDPARKERS